MPIKEMPTFKSIPDKMLDISQPAIGGVNLKDIEYEQDVNQSPYMLNVMYRNGAFGKRYGQELLLDGDGDPIDFGDPVYAMVYFGNYIFVHAGTKIYKYINGADATQVGSGLPQNKGIFIVFAQKLYYLISTGFYEYENNTFAQTDTYIPDFMVNCKPDGSDGADVVDDLNVIGTQASFIYNGDGTSTDYHVAEYNEQDIIDWSVTPTIYVDEEETTAFSVDTSTQVVSFTSPPAEGDLNVKMVFTLKSTVFSDIRAKIYSCKFYETFGGAQNSRLFLAGAGNSIYYWSASFDISYFPENNWARLGNTEDDITGFGRQYNVLIVFKPRETYSVSSYTETSSTTIIEENIGLENFRSQLVNPRIGCDAPYSIQLINNLLTWFNSREGICTLVSTNIQDERNIRLISRNVERTNNFGVKGVLDYDDDPATIQSADYNGRYFLVFSTSGICFMWDYEIVPYRYSSTGSETNPRELDWYIFDHFYVKQFLKVGDVLVFSSTNSDFNSKIVKLNSTFYDLDFNKDGSPDPIKSYYMTPFMQFGAVEMLKNVKNLYVQCRGDANTLIDLYYYTDDSPTPEHEPEKINVAGGGMLWNSMDYGSFSWFINVWGNTFRRKCNIKKVQMCAIYFENNEAGKDMSITHIGMQYSLVKYVR